LLFALRVFRNHKKAHAQHHAFAAPTVCRHRGTGHDRSSF
jgi:hypothetical protein